MGHQQQVKSHKPHARRMMPFYAQSQMGQSLLNLTYKQDGLSIIMICLLNCREKRVKYNFNQFSVQLFYKMCKSLAFIIIIVFSDVAIPPKYKLLDIFSEQKRLTFFFRKLIIHMAVYLYFLCLCSVVSGNSNQKMFQDDFM